jgi:uncharacterized protein (TIGR02271 family)
MSGSSTVEVTGPDGLRGTIDTAMWPLDRSRREVLVVLDDGRHLMVPVGLLRHEDGGSYHLPLVADQLAGHERPRAEATAGISEAKVAMPVVQEELVVGKRVEESGRVRIRKVVHEEEQIVDQPLTREEVTIERRAVQREVAGPQEVRTEGDATIIPVLREVLVVEKRWMVTEELVVRKRTVEERQPQTITLRREEAIVERLAPQGAGTSEEAAGAVTPPGASVDKAGESGKGGTRVAPTKSARH